MQTARPFWDADEPEDELDEIRSMSPEDRIALCFELCDLMRGILAHRPDRDAVLARQDPLPPESEALWRRLVTAGRQGG